MFQGQGILIRFSARKRLNYSVGGNIYLVIQTPNTKRQLGNFIRTINFYQYMWKRYACMLPPLIKLSGNTDK